VSHSDGYRILNFKNFRIRIGYGYSKNVSHTDQEFKNQYPLTSSVWQWARDDHYPVCRLDILQDSENCHQKSSTGRLYISAEGLDILNKYHCFIVLRISILGVLELCFGGAKPTNPLLWRWDYVAKLQLAFDCNWLGKLLRLRDISNLQDLSNFLFKSMTGLKVAQHIQVVSILLHEAKRVLGLFCLHLNTIGWSGHVTSTIHRDNWLEFKSLWLGFRIMAYGQGLVVQCLELGLACRSLNVNKMLLTACEL